MSQYFPKRFRNFGGNIRVKVDLSNYATKMLDFKDVGFKFQVCNGCHDLLTMAYYLKNIAILSAKGTTFRCLLMGINKNEALKKLNNSVTYDRGVL